MSSQSLSCCEGTQIIETKNIFDTPGGFFQFKASIFTENQILEKANHQNKYTCSSYMAKASVMLLK